MDKQPMNSWFHASKVLFTGKLKIRHCSFSWNFGYKLGSRSSAYIQASDAMCHSTTLTINNPWPDSVNEYKYSIPLTPWSNQ